MKEDWQKCFVCGKKYLQSSIKPITFYEHNFSKKWETVRYVRYKDKPIPLCNEHFRMCMLYFLIKNGYEFNIDGEHINE